MRKTLLALLGLLLTLGMVVVPAGSASAHTPVVSPTCEGLTVNLTAYAVDKPKKNQDLRVNTVIVTVNGTEVANQSFGASFSGTYPFANKYVANTYSVVVDAWDNDRYDVNTNTVTVDPCPLPEQPLPTEEKVVSEPRLDCTGLYQRDGVITTTFEWDGDSYEPVVGEPVWGAEYFVRFLTEGESIEAGCRPFAEPKYGTGRMRDCDGFFRRTVTIDKDAVYREETGTWEIVAEEPFYGPWVLVRELTPEQRERLNCDEPETPEPPVTPPPTPTPPPVVIVTPPAPPAPPVVIVEPTTPAPPVAPVIVVQDLSTDMVIVKHKHKPRPVKTVVRRPFAAVPTAVAAGVGPKVLPNTGASDLTGNQGLLLLGGGLMVAAGASLMLRRGRAI